MTTPTDALPTRDQIRELVKESGLDWHRGFVSLFDGDDTNRYEVLVRAALAAQAEAHAATKAEKLRQLVAYAELETERDALRAELAAEKAEVFRLQCSHSLLYAEVQALKTGAKK
jgi:hypothetical protein